VWPSAVLALAAALVPVPCERSADYDAEASAGRYELTFEATGDFEFSVRNATLLLERFSGAGPSALRCTYSQRPPADAAFVPRIIRGKGKVHLIGGGARIEKASGRYELWLEWSNPRFVYRAPARGSALPGTVIAPAAPSAFDNALEGRLSLEGFFKTETLIYVRAGTVHTSPRLMNATLTLSQPLPERALRLWRASADGCRTRTLTEPGPESGWTGVVAVTPRKPGRCTVTLLWRR
jgi:hypothetical protein